MMRYSSNKMKINFFLYNLRKLYSFNEFFNCKNNYVLSNNYITISLIKKLVLLTCVEISPCVDSSRISQWVLSLEQFAMHDFHTDVSPW